jgi:hypothetical protein
MAEGFASATISGGDIVSTDFKKLDTKLQRESALFHKTWRQARNDIGALSTPTVDSAAWQLWLIARKTPHLKRRKKHGKSYA